MKLVHRLTLDGMVQALRVRIHDLADSKQAGYNPARASDPHDSRKPRDDRARRASR